MRARAWKLGLVVAALGLAAPASAQNDGVRRDPEGKTGISPYMEEIAKGMKAFVAGDKAGATAAFQAAAKMDAGKALAFYRLGEVQISESKLTEAEASYNSANGKDGPPDLKAKVWFVLADLKERQQDWPAAKKNWKAYADFVQANPQSKGHPQTAVERIKQIDRRVQDEKDYGPGGSKHEEPPKEE